MALTETIVVDSIDIVGDFNHLQIRVATRIYDDNILVGQTFKRRVIGPLDDHSREIAEIQAICVELHTQQVKDAYIAFRQLQTKEV